MTSEISPEQMTVTASDGWPIAADLFRGPDPKIAILISAGTGFPRRFYGKAAAWLAAQGAIVMTFDFRGTGGSAVTDLASGDIAYHDWGRFDQTAVVEAAPSCEAMSTQRQISTVKPYRLPEPAVKPAAAAAAAAAAVLPEYEQPLDFSIKKSIL